VVGGVVRRPTHHRIRIDEDVSLSRLRSRNPACNTAHRRLARGSSDRPRGSAALAHRVLAGTRTPSPASMTEIRSNTVLPARRDAVTLHTADGLKLVGELASPLDQPPVATVVCLHPLPIQGGMMDSHLFRKAANRLPALAGIAVLRFNTRGTSSVQGTSEGAYDEGRAEQYDVAAALDFVDYSELPPPWLVGWSFGTDLALRYGLDPNVVGAVLISPPLKAATDDDLDRWGESGKPLVALVPEFDDYLRPVEARERFARVPQAEVVAVDGAKHLFVGARYANRVLDEIVRVVAPSSYPLPSEYGSSDGRRPLRP
jgi:alpha/beta superfamily hydrolase